jgi:ribonuclease HII
MPAELNTKSMADLYGRPFFFSAFSLLVGCTTGMAAQFIVGVDEAGRGPLAGPLAVGVVVVHKSFAIQELFPGVADSKVLSEKKREELYVLLVAYAKQGILRYTVIYVPAATIDRIGLTRATARAVYAGVRKLAPEVDGYKVLLDGLLHAPKEYVQETIIRGDATEPIISLASIAAKVSRDRLMKRLGKKHPKYGFEQHKGYGTKLHYKNIKKYGLSDLHRRSFIGEQLI